MCEHMDKHFKKLGFIYKWRYNFSWFVSRQAT